MKTMLRLLVAGGLSLSAPHQAALGEGCLVEVEVDYLEIQSEQGSRGRLADRVEVYQSQPVRVEAAAVKAAVKEWATVGVWLDPVTFVPPGMIHRIYVEDEGCVSE